MIFRCTKTFDTSEDGFSTQVAEGTIWMASYARPQNGYELVAMNLLENGAVTGTKVLVRASKLSVNFEMVPPDECYGVIGNVAYPSRGSDR